MTYLVIWIETALQELAAVWMASTDRNAITLATDEIDLILEVFPTASGEPVFDTVRELVHPPLAVEYEVDEATRTVHIISVWLSAQGRPPLAGN